MEYLAHSAQKYARAQTYREHVEQVTSRALRAAEEAARYAAAHQQSLPETVSRAALYHDLGKLNRQNQEVLRSERRSSPLPINHVDPGTAALLQQEDYLSALIVYAHHRGLPDLSTEQLREKELFRDEDAGQRTRTDQELANLLQLHNRLVSCPSASPCSEPSGDPSLFCRLALSCLADADHSDTARLEYHAPAEPAWPSLRPGQRLAALDAYVAGHGNSKGSDPLCRELYLACREAMPGSGFACCNVPVGAGQTTAAMAYLLRLAEEKHLRRIFVVLPHANRIAYAVQIYRQALTLPGEDPSLVVAELYHRAEFEASPLRGLTALWRAPIVVTTAAAFYETLASHMPATLRRLHDLPGSAVFVDEAHAVLPLPLIPLAWHWMEELARNWSCHWLLASSSPVRFWELRGLLLSEHPTPVRDLVPEALHNCFRKWEKQRITFRLADAPQSRDGLIRWVADAPGPRLLILNTVQSAAVLAEDFRLAYGRGFVEHLSPALTPEDCKATGWRIKARLADPQDRDWVLVATSYAETGMDLSFRTGFRECASLLSLLQAAAQVNRSGDQENAEVWAFTLQDDPQLTSHPGLAVSAHILKEYLSRGMAITPEWSTQSIQDELAFDHRIRKTSRELWEQEQSRQFSEVAKRFQVVGSDTVTVVVNPELVQQICHGKGGWLPLQQQSVSIPRRYICKYHLQSIGNGLYAWTLPYNSFLGYMAGVIRQGSS